MPGRLKNILSGIKKSFFLKKYHPSETTMKLLRDLYPRVNWNRVDFYEGLPWFTPIIAPYLTAQALPDFYSSGRYRIYLSKFEESRAQCLADLVHEAFHVFQAMNIWKGHGFGFFRGLMIYYAAWYLKYGYRQNPIEIPAYDQEFRFLDYCLKNGLHGIVPQVPPGAFNNVAKNEPELVFKEYKFRYHGSYLAFGASVLFCCGVTVLKPVVDVVLYAAGLAMKNKKSENSIV
jgi:hypothetical protein